MKFTLVINCDNAAFDPDCGGDLEMQVAMILRDAAKHVETGENHRSLMDLNGNRVGSFAFSNND